ncbi:MAG: hypothetical protein GXO74_07465 [Calditrichaeota bacterium]|nr:hypothetical protein [Calditrichota bacterium]
MSEIAEKQRIVSMLLQSTLRCAEFYEVLSAHSRHEQLKKVFTGLSKDGRQLGRRLESWSELSAHIHPRQYFDFDRSRFYFESLSRKSLQANTETRAEVLPELADTICAIQIAISFEKDGILFWEEMKSVCEGRLSDFVKELISLKKQRLSMLLNMKGKLASG